MKINLAYRSNEADQAAAVINAVKELIPNVKVKQTGMKNEYFHAYLLTERNNSISTARNG